MSHYLCYKAEKGKIFSVKKGSTDQNRSVPNQNRKNEKSSTEPAPKNKILRPTRSDLPPDLCVNPGIDYRILGRRLPYCLEPKVLRLHNEVLQKLCMNFLTGVIMTSQVC